MMAAGKNATADGSVMVARSCDSTGGGDAVKVLSIPRRTYQSGETILIPGSDKTIIPQVENTYSYVSVMRCLEGASINENEGGVNEYQVSAGASTGGYLNSKAQEVCPRMPKSVGDYRMTLVLERCKTAKEGIELIGELTDRYGARTDNYIVADPEEAWFYEEYQGNLWAAARVPDDCYVVQANTVRIDFIDNDPDIFRCSTNLVKFAVEHGLYDSEKDGDFKPSQVYGAQTGKNRHNIPAPEYDRRRLWRGISLLSPSIDPKPEEPTWKYPLFIKPDRKIVPKDFLDIFLDRYEGTEYDIYGKESHMYKPTVSPMIARGKRVYLESPFHINEKREYQLAPNWGTERLIGTPRSITNWCVQLRGWMPNPIGGLLWASIGEGATTPRLPWYVGVKKTPEPYMKGTNIQRRSPTDYNIYDPNSAYWNYRIITNLVNLFYTATNDEVLPIWRAWEEGNYKLQNAVEKTALELYETNPDLALDFITTYSNAKAIEALEIAKEMIVKLHSIISHYNSPL